MSDIDNDAVKAFGLGFRDKASSDAWIDLYLNHVPFGLVIDAHLLFEHLWNFVSGNEDTIKILHSMQRLNLTKMNEGL